MWAFIFPFSLNLQGQEGHWKAGSLPHSYFWCLCSDVEWRYDFIQTEHTYIATTHITSITVYLQRCQIKLQVYAVKLYYYTSVWEECINFRWRFMFAFSLDRWGHNGHWNVGSLPHSNFTCLFKEATWRYPFPHCGQRCKHSATKHH